jgi:hypothetical protein
MNKKTPIFAKLLWFVAGGLMAHLAYAQDSLPDAQSTMSAPAPVTADSMPSESAAPRGMLHHWPRLAPQARGEKSLNELLVEHPELQTHSHMTYYSSPIKVGERARLQPPGSEFAH